VRFSTPVQTGPGAQPASYTMDTGSFPGVKRPGRDVNHPPQFSAEVKERVELYLYFTSGPSWPVPGWTDFTLTFLFFSFFCSSVYAFFIYASSELFAIPKLKIQSSWDMKLRHGVNGSRRFKWTYFFHFQGSSIDIGIQLLNKIASYVTTESSSIFHLVSVI
jgi:hypothetical protein